MSSGALDQTISGILPRNAAVRGVPGAPGASDWLETATSTAREEARPRVAQERVGTWFGHQRVNQKRVECPKPSPDQRPAGQQARSGRNGETYDLSELPVNRARD